MNTRYDPDAIRLEYLVVDQSTYMWINDGSDYRIVYWNVYILSSCAFFF